MRAKSGPAGRKNGFMTTPSVGPMLRLVLLAGYALSPFANSILRRRLDRGKEDPDRIGERQGISAMDRDPEADLVWLHGVGLGEIQALRALVPALKERRPDLQFLVTSVSKNAAEVVENNPIEGAHHQYLPLDLPRPVSRFLDHWRPNLAIWTDQDIWPRLAVECARRGIPQALVNGRMSERSARARGRFGRAYAEVYQLLDAIWMQDETSVKQLRFLAPSTEPQVTPSIKASAPPLADNLQARSQIEGEIDRRPVWCAASTHPADEKRALAAQREVGGPGGPLLIIAPRDPSRGSAVADAARRSGLKVAQWSQKQTVSPQTDVLVADSFGDLGAWYRLSDFALIGGTFDSTEGHNPWEAVALETAVLHGPRTANFAEDFRKLDAAGGAILVENAAEVAIALTRPDQSELIEAAWSVRSEASKSFGELTASLIALLEQRQ